MSAAVSRLSRLSLEDMPPTTRSQARTASQATSGHDPDQEESSSDLESDSDVSDFDDEEMPTVVRSPTKLIYNLDQLSERRRGAVRDVFSEPPKIALQRCRRIGNTYAFQMTELVTRSIRIRAPDSGASRLSCTCGEEDTPCMHLVWLLDQLQKQTLYGHDDSKPLTMTAEGFAEEMGDPFQNIADCHLDVRADGLHCPVVVEPGAHPDEELDRHRVLESRELLSSIYRTDPEDFRPDIFTHPAPGKKVLKRHDLGCSVFRMLLDNHHFFHYFLSLSRPADPINDPFRKLSQRVARVLRDLDAYSPEAACSSSTTTAAATCAEPPADVSWAARHLVGTVQLIRSAIYNRDHPLQRHEKLSAARALVHVLAAVVARNRDAHPGPSRRSRKHYLNLIGDGDQDFVVAELNLLPPEAVSAFLHTLEAVHDQIGLHGAPASYVAKLRTLLARLRTSTPGLKRHGKGQGTHRGSKRMK
ncbi:hypothetical protein TOPH_00094 [Tolypocladium ophioglossoides CBS 100239]|uniref:SWIM-type domain-containing protein n=1 Tax=Tolypocladium ophioglossoides (strain CBS 100239) TaxID=1163406 RepID=A0A0L0NLY8_TOLOC|nr:hypothetical protein TOPH_00094 [Tolypocladium ophioglossoides CBS 100239]